LAPEPLQLSATSQLPAEPRHVPLVAKAFVGQLVALPLQVSATSHMPAASRQGVPALAARKGAPHTGAPVPQETVPMEQASAVGHSAPGVHVLLQVPAPSQNPAAQLVPSLTNASKGQMALTPLHDSATSQLPAAGRHAPLAAKASSGQVGVDPSQTSSASQAPADARHTVRAGCPAQGTAPQSRAQLPAQQRSPEAQRGARSQRPATQLALSQGAATHVVALQTGPASAPASVSSPVSATSPVSASGPVSSLTFASAATGRAMQPVPGRQTWSAVQSASLGR